MSDPRCEELAKRHCSELGMLAGERKLVVGERPAAQRLEVRRSEQLESIEQLGDGLVPVELEMPEAIEWHEPATLTLRENDSRAWNPVGFFAIDEMPDDVERAPRVVALIAPQPFVAVAGEKRAQRAGRSLEDGSALADTECRVR